MIRIEFQDLFPFILPIYKVKVVCGFVMITQVTMIYGFGRVFFFLLNLNLLSSIFFLYS